jgi:ComF family protein
MDKRLAGVKAEQVGHGPGGLLRQAAAFMLDQLYPPVCINCDVPLAHPDALCAACWRELRPITEPMCPVLGLPFEVSLGPEARSAEAIADPPPFGKARSAVVYNGVARAVVSRLKYGDRPELAGFCARLMAAACTDILEDGPVLVPVPLHATRQWRRRYNQSTELVRALARLTGLDMAAFLVRRRRRTAHQVGLSADQRARNVAGAFAVDPNALAAVLGRRIVIVDDVITTGATVKAMTRAMKRAGIDQIDVISFARVVAGGQTPI